MQTKVRADRSDLSELTPEQEAAVKAVSMCVNQLARTLKTCRLYETSNSTVEKFRRELTETLRQTLDQHGSIALRFTPDDVTYEEVSLYSARVRDDNLAFPFYRDGIRTLVFSSGVEQAEVDVLVNALARVTGQNTEQDDLVTLLWEAHLPHIQVDYVPGVSDAGEGSTDGEGGIPWPMPSLESEAPGGADSAEDAGGEAARSDDWPVGTEPTVLVEGFEELLALAPTEVERFRQEFEQEHRVPLLTTANRLARVYLSVAGSVEDQLDGGRFVTRVLRHAVSDGSWASAAESLRLLAECEALEWSQDAFAQELLQPIAIAAAKERLETQSPDEVAAFVNFALCLGDDAPDLLNLVRAEIQNTRHQRVLVEAIVQLCREQPERLAPWLSDPRAAVVRNVVQMLGSIGGSAIVGPLQAAASHHDLSVRAEVVNALRQVEPRAARPLLSRLLESGDSRMFCSVLALLAQERNDETAVRVVGYVTDLEFERRSPEEKHAIYTALSTLGSDEILPILETELHKGSWFQRGPDLHRHAIARCIARIGTPYALQMLEQGARSRRGPVRKACEDAMARGGRS